MSHPVGRCICKDEPVEGHQGRQNEGVWRLRRLKELPVARARHFRRLRRRASRRRGEQEAEQQNEDASHHVRGSCLPCGCLSFPPNPSHREIRRRQSSRIVAKHTRGRQTAARTSTSPVTLTSAPVLASGGSPASFSLARSLARPPTLGSNGCREKKMRDAGGRATKNGDFGDPTGQKHGNQK